MLLVLVAMYPGVCQTTVSYAELVFIGVQPTGYIPDRPVKAGGFWTVDYYQPYFDVDTKTVRLPPYI